VSRSPWARRYDPITEQPVTRFGHGSLFLSVPSAIPVRNVTDLIAHAKTHPDKANYGSPGNGTPPHLGGALFAQLAGLQAAHAPYRGGGALMNALLGGELMWCVEGLTAQLHPERRPPPATSGGTAH
jgi:tripartite-type tricarboxylate transporter receptor subunit TctC